MVEKCLLSIHGKFSKSRLLFFRQVLVQVIHIKELQCQRREHIQEYLEHFRIKCNPSALVTRAPEITKNWQGFFNVFWTEIKQKDKTAIKACVCFIDPTHWIFTVYGKIAKSINSSACQFPSHPYKNHWGYLLDMCYDQKLKNWYFLTKFGYSHIFWSTKTNVNSRRKFSSVESDKISAT